MPITVAPTPNPNALKFNCGAPVGGPSTYVAGVESDLPFVDQILAITGVSSIFMTADFVTVSKGLEGDWAVIEPKVVDILETQFGG